MFCYKIDNYNDFLSAIQSLRNYRSKGFKLIPTQAFRVGSWGIPWQEEHPDGEYPEDLYLTIEDKCNFSYYHPKFILKRGGLDRNGSFILTKPL